MQNQAHFSGFVPEGGGAENNDELHDAVCFYANAKLARYLTRVTADVEYGDRLERVLFNTILGALDRDDDGSYLYYSDYQAHATRAITSASGRAARDAAAIGGGFPAQFAFP